MIVSKRESAKEREKGLDGEPKTGRRRKKFLTFPLGGDPIKMIYPMIQQCNHSLTFTIPTDVPWRFSGGPGRLEQNWDDVPIKDERNIMVCGTWNRGTKIGLEHIRSLVEMSGFSLTSHISF